MNARTIIQQQMLECPACGKNIDAAIQVDVRLGAAVMNGDKNEVPAHAKVLGVRIEHDCTKQATR